ncbi:hypothetical protein ACHAWO_002145 [Cyclotella atomus]|uniref:GrpE protein homolog n=1 Tax=Cyclotella atomus TaxID=382360 RepID=A0ABD3QQB0_9STRA
MSPLSKALSIALSLAASAPSIYSFSTVPSITTSSSRVSSPTFPIRMADTETSEESNETPEAPADAATEPEPEDPEITALKSQIAALETDVKSKRSSLSSIQELADRYSKEGYARQVALMENNKRIRGANMADSKYAARASVIRTFMPVLDDLDTVADNFAGDEFATSLSALRSEFVNSLGQLGMSEYVASVGDVVDGRRIVAVDEEYSEEVAKGAVVSVLRNGLEVKGNVVRPAKCVGSLGSEEVEEDAAADEGAAKEGEGEQGGEEAAAE